MTTKAWAVDLLDTLADVAGRPDALFTLDPGRMRSALDAGRTVVTVNPPRVTYPTFAHADAEWSVVVASGPAGDYLRAWDQLDDMVTALCTPAAGIESAEPSTFDTSGTGGRGYPAYLLTLTTAHEI